MGYFYEYAIGLTAGTAMAVALLAMVYVAVEHGPWVNIREFLGDAVGALGLLVLFVVLAFASLVY